MTSNMLSRLVPTTTGRSFYESLRAREEDAEDRAGLLDEENLSHNFHDYDLDHAEGLGVEDSRATLGGVTSPALQGRRSSRGRTDRDHARDAWPPHEDNGDNDVPGSLLVEHHGVNPGSAARRSKRNRRGSSAAAIPGPSKAHSQWEAAQAQQRLHSDDGFGPSRRGAALPTSLFAGVVSGNAKKKAEWRWANVSNLDNFIKDVYDYYLGHGMWCILVDRVLHLV